MASMTMVRRLLLLAGLVTATATVVAAPALADTITVPIGAVSSTAPRMPSRWPKVTLSSTVST